ncbi:MAG: 1,4-dihydroxy-2-naphthoate polyprenyltransferase [Actinomycetota bacterium]|nr:1,4-dihydroxy-2-naphthoate polyprenyltransferase [Actinomycetota bacterium]
MVTARQWIAGARPRTLPAAVVPVAVGTSAVVGEGDVIWWRAGAALVVALALQVGVNYANDYSDGVRGTDSAARVGPLRLVGSGIAEPSAVKWAALTAFGVAAVSGGALALAVGWELFLVGAAAIAAAWFYTGGRRPYGYLGLGEIFVFVFFGLVATVGSTYVHLARITLTSVLLACSVGALSVALLVVNNLRDRVGDEHSGKRTLAVRLGDLRTRRFYVGLVVGAAVPVVVVAFSRPLALLALGAAAVARRPIEIVRSGAVGGALIEALGGTARTLLVGGALLTAGVALSGVFWS